MDKQKKSRKKKSSAAPGQFYGYAIVQSARLLHRLLEAQPGDHVSVEGLDDISVMGDDCITAEQDKSGLAHNPVTDRSVDLWKTFYNWLEGVRNGNLPSGTKFVLYVAQEHTGNVVEQMHACNSVENGRNLVLQLRQKFWGESLELEKKSEKTENTREYLDVVLGADDDVLAEMFSHFEFIKGSGEPYEDIKILLARAAIGANAIEPVLQSMIGFVQRHVARCIESRNCPSMSQVEFHVQLLAYVRKFDRADKELLSFERPISDEEVISQIRNGTYIRQLKLVKLEDAHLTDAVIEYLRTAADRAEWGIKGYVVEESLNEYQQELEKAWRRNKIANGIAQDGKAEEIIGQALYLKCMEIRQPLQRMEVPDHFTRGSFHALADSRSVGWHPRYNEMLNLNEEDQEGEKNAE